MGRTTRNDADRVTALLATKLGVPYKPVGPGPGIRCDYQPQYGGAAIQQWEQGDSGEWWCESYPLGGMLSAGRMPLRQYCDTIWAVLRILDWKEQLDEQASVSSVD
jgi:hypothetical protein